MTSDERIAELREFRENLKHLIVESLKLRIDQIGLRDAIWLELRQPLDYAEDFARRLLRELEKLRRERQ